MPQLLKAAEYAKVVQLRCFSCAALIWEKKWAVVQQYLFQFLFILKRKYTENITHFIYGIYY